MNKIKINLMSGSSLEKPLITAFTNNGAQYVVFDNEMNGSMGLPIILVTKLANNTLSMISDSEWTSVKEALRMIIAGNAIDYVSVPDMVGAEDMFFRQLTLPLASFESLKNNYKPLGSQNDIGMSGLNVGISAEQTPVSPVQPSTFVSPTIKQAAPATASNMNNPMPDVNNVNVFNPMVNEQVTSNNETTSSVKDFTADKEAFMKACENMFDALVAKFSEK